MNQRQTQTQAILRAFKESNNILTPPEIMKLGIAQYNARIKELRKEGYVITNEYLGTFSGVKHTQFTLRSEPQKYGSTPAEKPQNFPSLAHKIAHENRVKAEANQDQLQLI